MLRFSINNPILRKRFIKRYQKTAQLYYNGQPQFEGMITEIKAWVSLL